MPWFPVGSCSVGPGSREVSVGRVAGDLLDGRLHLRIATAGGAGGDPLSFLVVDFLNSDEVRCFGSEQFWVKPQPAAVVLGPSPDVSVDGEVLIGVRGINRRRLSGSGASRSVRFAVEVFLSAGGSAPRLTAPFVSDDGRTLDLVGGPVGPAGAFSLRLSDG